MEEFLNDLEINESLDNRSLSYLNAWFLSLVASTSLYGTLGIFFIHTHGHETNNGRHFLSNRRVCTFRRSSGPLSKRRRFLSVSDRSRSRRSIIRWALLMPRWPLDSTRNLSFAFHVCLIATFAWLIYGRLSWSYPWFGSKLQVVVFGFLYWYHHIMVTDGENLAWRNQVRHPDVWERMPTSSTNANVYIQCHFECTKYSFRNRYADINY